ncbi:hypothetical protein ES705_30685 [subsurface metagenome]
MNMNLRTRIFTRKSAMPIILLMSLLIFVPFTITSAEVTELNVTPEVVVQGETLSISGKASLPDEEVWIGSSFAISLPVSDGEYCREFIGIYFPEGEKEFSVTAENVKNIRISLSPIPFLGTVEYPLEGPLNATNGTATISISFPISTPFGPVDVSVYGDAVVEDATSVNLKVATSIKVPANSNGDFTLDISTGGVPIGEFLITAGGIEKRVEVVSTKPTPTPTPTPTPSSNGGDGDSGDGDGGSGSDAPETTPTPTPASNTTITENVTSNETTPTPTPTLIPTSTPVSTTTPQTTVIENETGDKTPGPTPENETNQTPQETPKPSSIPGFGFEAIGYIAIAALIWLL